MVKMFEIIDKILYNIIYQTFTVAICVYSGDVLCVYYRGAYIPTL